MELVIGPEVGISYLTEKASTVGLVLQEWKVIKDILERLWHSPCKPRVVGLIPDFNSLSDETLSYGPIYRYIMALAVDRMLTQRPNLVGIKIFCFVLRLNYIKGIYLSKALTCMKFFLY